MAFRIWLTSPMDPKYNASALPGQRVPPPTCLDLGSAPGAACLCRRAQNPSHNDLTGRVVGSAVLGMKRPGTRPNRGPFGSLALGRQDRRGLPWEVPLVVLRA